jgi:hypothetical protein
MKAAKYESGKFVLTGTDYILVRQGCFSKL